MESFGCYAVVGKSVGVHAGERGKVSYAGKSLYVEVFGDGGGKLGADVLDKWDECRADGFALLGKRFVVVEEFVRLDFEGDGVEVSGAVGDFVRIEGYPDVFESFLKCE